MAFWLAYGWDSFKLGHFELYEEDDLYFTSIFIMLCAMRGLRLPYMA